MLHISGKDFHSLDVWIFHAVDHVICKLFMKNAEISVNSPQTPDEKCWKTEKHVDLVHKRGPTRRIMIYTVVIRYSSPVA